MSFVAVCYIGYSVYVVLTAKVWRNHLGAVARHNKISRWRGEGFSPTPRIVVALPAYSSGKCQNVQLARAWR